MCVTSATMGKLIRELNLGQGKGAGAAARKWKGTNCERAFREWWYGTCEEAVEETVEETVTDELVAVNENAEIQVAEGVEGGTCGDNAENGFDICCSNPYHQIPVIPKEGSIRFDSNYADDILDTVRSLLANTKVNLSVIWSVVEE